MPNGIDLILADHRAVAELFETFAETGDGTLIGRIVGMLQAHDDAEQAALYPMIGNVLDDADAVTRAAAAHSAVKKQIDVLMGLEGGALTDAFVVLMGLVQEHVDDEQDHLLPALATAATPAQLELLGARLLQAKQRGG